MHIAFKIQKASERVWQKNPTFSNIFPRGKILENVGFFKETRQNLPFIEKYATNKFSYV